MNTEKQFGPIPDKEGIWEWYDENGKKVFVSVCDVGIKGQFEYLRAYYLGGYYNIKDETPTVYEEDDICQYDNGCEWPQRWGEFICTHDEAGKVDLNPHGWLNMKKEDEVLGVYRGIFGKTPLEVRLTDIEEEADELKNYYSEENLREELGDLICSCFALASEKGWDVETLINENLGKVIKRYYSGHYHATGEAKNG